MSEDVSGTWVYRSLLNDPDPSTVFNDLAFGLGQLNLALEGDILTGTLGGSGWSLALTGAVKSGDPTHLRFQGRGEIGGETWVYDYLCYSVPDWSHGIEQRDALVGSVIRTEPHSNGQAEAGFSASFYAVRA
ncbi:hypothetical protein [Limimaricola cinnabarinus]|uniref:hypothetical protein n=1 Tax=Limimaricola cinnabarinus TaxID=1125964 RepID=UPI0009DB9C13|nr:hypothetical protein [Limimaricola cinnabarinus]